MGVPKFYRWISERYPCLSQVVKDYQIPEFDNFYLDMNGIIHTCSHPNDDDPFFRITEDKIFSDIFRYLEALFRIIKPQKVLFMAVDGVAPRAKMNQQRGRRFRSAKEAEEQSRKALAKGLDLPSEARFDSNCITPGTPFMTRLNEQLKYFINQKLSTDPSWQKVEVIFSGHEVPGEGEHKIMDYIRYCKSQPNYDSNIRHCLYGLDADLIMLGLATHEPHFCLLREEVKFGKNNNKAKLSGGVDSVTFHLLHLSIMREYLEYEFISLKDQLSFPFNLESIIDDWILMGFLVGNDFIPHLPNMHIRQEILPYLYKIYKKVLPTLNGYINENGCLNMERIEKYLEALAQYDREYFEELIADSKWMEGKKTTTKKRGKGKREGERGEGEGGITDDMDFGQLDSLTSTTDTPSTDSANDNTAADEKLMRDLGIPDLEKYFKEEDDVRHNQFEIDMRSHKSLYYRNKFHIHDITDDTIHELAKCYIVGLQWILSYYYTGVPSWSWFYPYHYAPYVSDIKGISDLLIQFELGSPFLPFEQLLAVLPSNSKSLLPLAYQTLMTSNQSPVIDFYPTDFDHDLNGKQHEWEAVVLIPFIDEDRLIEAMKPLSNLLTEEEVTRNSHGPCLVYKFSKEYPAVTYPSPWPTQFSDVINCKVKCQVLSSDPYRIQISELVFGLCSSVKLDVYFPGFPTLKHVSHEAYKENKGVRVFQTASRGESICLKVLPLQNMQQSIFDIAKELVSKTCFVRWPYLIEGRVWSVSDGQRTYYDDNDRHGGGAKGRKLALTHRSLSQDEEKKFQDFVNIISKQNSTRYGIDVGPINILVYVEELQGKRYVMDKTGHRGTMILEKQWSANPTPYPLQTIVKNITQHAPEYKEKVKTLGELYEVGSQCFVLSPPYYGEQAEVISVDARHSKVSIKFTVQPEPNMEHVVGNYDKLNEQYSTIHQVSQRLELDPALVARITSSLQCEKGSIENKKERERVNLGLNLKFSQRNLELVGYARRTHRGGWLLSPAAENILKEYKEKFPKMFAFLTEHPRDDHYYESDLFPVNESNPHETIAAAKDWLKSLPTSSLTPVECGSDTLNSSHIADIEMAVNTVKNSPIINRKVITHKYNPSQIYKPGDHQGGLIPDEFADFFLFDRVVNIASNGAVPFGLRGTLTGIYGNGSDNKTLYEIVFDEEFLGGLPLRCSGNRSSRLPPSCLINLSYGKRWEAYTPTHHPTKQATPTFNRSNSYSSVLATSSPRHASPRNHGDRLSSASYYIGKPYKESAIGTRSMEGGSHKENKLKKKREEGSSTVPTPTVVLTRRKDNNNEKSSEFDTIMSSLKATPLGTSPKLITPQEMTLPPSRSLTAPQLTTPALTTPVKVPSTSQQEILTPQQLTTPQKTNSMTTPTTQWMLTPQDISAQSTAAQQVTASPNIIQSLFDSPQPKTTPPQSKTTPKQSETTPIQSETTPIDIPNIQELFISPDNNRRGSSFSPSVAAVFEHHKQQETTPPNKEKDAPPNKEKDTPPNAEKDTPPSPRTQQEANLKSLLGIVPSPRGPVLQPRGPIQQGILQPRGPTQQSLRGPMQQRSFQLRGPTLQGISQPRGPINTQSLHQPKDYQQSPRGVLSLSDSSIPHPPQLRGPVNSVNSQPRGPIMSTGYHPRQQNQHSSSSGPPLLPMPPSPWYGPGGYPPLLPYPPPGAGMVPSLSGYPSPLYPPSLMGHPYWHHHPSNYSQYPAPFLRGPSRSSPPILHTPPPTSNLNPMSIPFTPLQVQIKHGSKLNTNQPPIPGNKENQQMSSSNPSPPHSSSTAKDHHTSSSSLLVNDSLEEHTTTNVIKEPGDINLVEAIQSTAIDDRPHVVGEIVNLKQFN